MQVMLSAEKPDERACFACLVECGSSLHEQDLDSQNACCKHWSSANFILQSVALIPILVLKAAKMQRIFLNAGLCSAQPQPAPKQSSLGRVPTWHVQPPLQWQGSNIDKCFTPTGIRVTQCYLKHCHGWGARLEDHNDQVTTLSANVNVKHKHVGRGHKAKIQSQGSLYAPPPNSRPRVTSQTGLLLLVFQSRRV